jgi:protein-disulfide isomerase
MDETMTPSPEVEENEEVLKTEDSETDVPETDAPDWMEDTEAEESKKRPFPKQLLWAILIFVLAFGVGIGSGYLIWGRENKKVAADQPKYQIPADIQRLEVSEDGNPSWGRDDAPITIIEFSDYECPYCRKWHDEVWPLIQKEYKNKVRLVYRDFPLESIHSNATPAAAAANCANEQGAYWEFNEALFSMKYDLNVPSYQQYADELKLDMDAFNECIESKRYNAEVQADLEYAYTLGIQSTPTFFVNGLAVVGAQPYDLFEFIIEKELAGEIP